MDGRAGGATWIGSTVPIQCACAKRSSHQGSDRQYGGPAFDLLKSMAAVGRTAPDNLILPPPLVHAAHDAVVLGMAAEKFIGGGFITRSCRQW